MFQIILCFVVGSYFLITGSKKDNFAHHKAIALATIISAYKDKACLGIRCNNGIRSFLALFGHIIQLNPETICRYRVRMSQI